jgi:hypothetical protein
MGTTSARVVVALVGDDDDSRVSYAGVCEQRQPVDVTSICLIPLYDMCLFV